MEGPATEVGRRLGEGYEEADSLQFVDESSLVFFCEVGNTYLVGSPCSPASIDPDVMA